MKMTKIVGILVLAAALTGIAVKHLSSKVKDSYFDPATDKLRLLPANLVVVRPTHFPDAGNSAFAQEMSRFPDQQRM